MLVLARLPDANVDAPLRQIHNGTMTISVTVRASQEAVGRRMSSDNASQNIVEKGVDLGVNLQRRVGNVKDHQR